MIMKRVIVTAIIMLLNACSGNIGKVKDEITVMPPLPQKCGMYSIVYGNIDDILRLGIRADKRPNDRFNLLFENENKVSVPKDTLLKKYTSKTLLYAMESWQQTIGGILYPDGTNGGVYTNTLVYIKLIQVVENGKVDMKNLLRECNKMKDN